MELVDDILLIIARHSAPETLEELLGVLAQSQGITFWAVLATLPRSNEHIVKMVPTLIRNPQGVPALLVTEPPNEREDVVSNSLAKASRSAFCEVVRGCVRQEAALRLSRAVSSILAELCEK